LSWLTRAARADALPCVEIKTTAITHNNAPVTKPITEINLQLPGLLISLDNTPLDSPSSSFLKRAAKSALLIFYILL
jgi:hypothetical protein